MPTFATQIIIHVVILLFAASCVFFLMGTGSFVAPGFRLVFWAVVSYPILLILGIILAKTLDPRFIYLPIVNFIVSVAFIVLTFFLLFSSIRGAGKALEKIKSDYSTEMQSANKDFTCDDGSFFNLTPTIADPASMPGILYDVNYYSPDANLRTSAGRITIDNKSKIEIISGNIKENAETIKQKLSVCKNSSGKTLLEVYPE